MLAPVPPWKYAPHLARCLQPCPTEKFQPRMVRGYRFVRNPTTANDFLPVSERPGFDRSRATCEHYALSFFKTLDGARTRWASLQKRCDAAARYGDHVAEVMLNVKDGAADLPDDKRSGHFSLHEFAATSLHSRVDGLTPVGA